MVCKRFEFILRFLGVNADFETYTTRFRPAEQCSVRLWQFFGHALTLLSGTPWDLMEKWIRMFKGKPVRIQVRG
jgi:phosphoserine phosphatase